MQVVRVSNQGKFVTMEIAITQEQLSLYNKGMLELATVIPALTQKEINFIKFGIV